MMVAAYCWPQSTVGGHSIALHCSTAAASFDVEVVRQGLEDVAVWSARAVPGREHTLPSDAGALGCRWPAALEIPVDDAWRSGFYLVRLRTEAGETAEAFFVVRAKRPCDALLVLSTSTWAAYNDWGGPSFYTGGHVSSLERPLPKGFLARPEPHRFRAARVGELPDEEVGAYLAPAIRCGWWRQAGRLGNCCSLGGPSARDCSSTTRSAPTSKRSTGSSTRTSSI